MKFKIVLLLFLFINLSQLFAQTRKLYRKAIKTQYYELYPAAIALYDSIVKLDSIHAKALFNKGKCHLLQDDASLALKLMEKSNEIRRLKKDKLYWYARVLHANYRFGDAIVYYAKYIQKTKKSNPNYIDAKSQIKKCEYGLSISKEYGEYKIFHLSDSINSPYTEHSPTALQNDSMLAFTTRIVNKKKNKIWEEITFRVKGIPTKDNRIQNMIKSLNKKGHDACSQLYSKDKLYMYRSTWGGDIYSSKLDSVSFNWTSPIKFPRINTLDFESSSFMNKAGNRLYFSTNHYSNKGNLDIYVIEKSASGIWSNPKELSNHINSPQDEDGIFVSDDEKTIYFASRGHKNMGGYDLFYSKYDEKFKVWQTPVNMGAPFNTPFDDIYYFESQNGKKMYFTSQRNDTYGQRDIYYVLPIKKVKLKGNFFDISTNKIIDYPFTVKITSEFKYKKVIKQVVDYENKIFEVDLPSDRVYKIQVYFHSDLLMQDTVWINHTADENTFIKKDIKFDFEKTIKGISYQTEKSILEQALEYDFGVSELNENQKQLIQLFVQNLKSSAYTSIQVIGFADKVGDETDNFELSLKRANKVKDYLVKQGINENKIITLAKGEKDGNSRKVNLEVK